MTTTCKTCARRKDGNRCARCHAAHMAQLRAEADRVIATGKCPQCGTALVRNVAQSGWYQCGAYADERMRTPQFRGLPSCSFQVFGS